jgi:hypothetical protein
VRQAESQLTAWQAPVKLTKEVLQLHNVKCAAQHLREEPDIYDTMRGMNFFSKAPSVSSCTTAVLGGVHSSACEDTEPIVCMLCKRIPFKTLCKRDFVRLS